MRACASEKLAPRAAVGSAEFRSCVAARDNAPLCASEKLAQNGAPRAAVGSAEFLSCMAARKNAPLCASEELAQNGAPRAAVGPAEFRSCMAARDNAPLLRKSRKTGRPAPLLDERSSAPVWRRGTTRPFALCASRYFVAAALLMLGVSAVLNGQTTQGAPAQDPGAPERGVARISVVNGEVSVRRGDSGDWVAAVINAPMMVEDRIATGANSRAEVQFDSSNLIRVGANAEVRVAELGYNRYHLQVAHGTVTFRVLRESHARVDVDTPTVSIRPSHVGAYRIYVQGDGQTEITVRLGSVEVATPRGSKQLQAGQTMLARGDPADPEFRVDAGYRDGRLGPLERAARSGDAEFAELRQRAAGCVRHRGFGQPRPVGGRAVLWRGLGSHSRSGLGAVSERPLGLGRLLWVDLGQLRPLGLGAISLRPLVLCGALRLVLVSGRFRTRITGLPRWWVSLDSGQA